MTDMTAATFYDVTSFDGRRLGACCRALANSVVLGLGAVTTVGVLGASVTFGAAWMLNTTLSGNPHLHASAWSGPETLTLSGRTPKPSEAPPALAKAQPVRMASAPAMSFDAKWAQATAFAPGAAEAVRVVAEPPVTAPHQPAKPHLAKTPAATQVAALTPPATPAPVKPVSAPAMLPRPVARPAPAQALTIPLPRSRPHVVEPKIASAPAEKPTPKLALAVPPPAVPEVEKRATPEKQAHNKAPALPGPDSHTAVYDIAAHTVYMPNGERLEAHSGIGSKMDDPDYIRVKMRGPTPPNVYNLTLRESLFHGVRAIRLNPIDDRRMFGRDGMLAHTYMLGPSGQSNGCVSFKNYRAFLQAYLRGEVDRMIVVAHLGDAPPHIAERVRRSHGYRYAENVPATRSSGITW